MIPSSGKAMTKMMFSSVQVSHSRRAGWRQVWIEEKSDANTLHAELVSNTVHQMQQQLMQCQQNPKDCVHSCDASSGAFLARGWYWPR